MMDAAQAAQSFASGVQRSELDSDQMRVFAIIRAVEIIGEAASKITKSYRDAHPEIT